MTLQIARIDAKDGNSTYQVIEELPGTWPRNFLLHTVESTRVDAEEYVRVFKASKAIEDSFDIWVEAAVESFGLLEGATKEVVRGYIT